MTQQQTDHVQQLITGYIDDELTQQDSQRVRVHCESCAICAEELSGLLELRQQVQLADLDAHPAEHWHENIPDQPVEQIRTLGWLLIVVGLIIATGTGVYLVVRSIEQLSLVGVLIVGGIYGGLLLLLVSVVRQRLIERKTDKYKDVEI